MSRPDDRHDGQGTGTPGRDASPDAGHLSDELLTAHLDDDLTPAARARVVAHLAGCAACRERAAEMQGLVALLAGLPAPRARRSFLLPPDAVKTAQPWWQRLVPATSALRAVTAVIVLLIVAGVVRASLGGGNDGNAPTAAPQISMKVADTPTAAAIAAQRNTAEIATNQQVGASAPTPTVGVLAKSSGAGAAGAAESAPGPSEPEIGATDVAASAANDSTTGGDVTGGDSANVFAAAAPAPGEPTQTVAAGGASAGPAATSNASASNAAAGAAPAGGDVSTSAMQAGANESEASAADSTIAGEGATPAATPLASPAASPVAPASPILGSR